MTTYWGSNKNKVLWLAKRMGVDRETVISTPFVTGTMFYARTPALRPLLNLGISDDIFEKEDGQVDEALAHALERDVAISAYLAGYKLLSSDFSSAHKMSLTAVMILLIHRIT